MADNADRAIERLGLTLPPPPKPVGAYRPFQLVGELAFLSGQLARTAEGKVIMGKAGSELSVEEAKAAARGAALQVVSLIRSQLGFSRVREFVRVVGYVQSAPDFQGQSEVLNGASELFVELFGEKGKHARTAVGVASLPVNAAVELEVTLRVR